MPPTLYFFSTFQISEKQCREALSTDPLAPQWDHIKRGFRVKLTHSLLGAAWMTGVLLSVCECVCSSCVGPHYAEQKSGHRTITITATLEKSQRPANDVMECFVCLYEWNSTYIVIHTMGRMRLENVDQC